MPQMRGLPIGSQNTKLDPGTENDNLKVIGYSHYDTKYRRHYSTMLCKHCGKEFLLPTYMFDRQKSCGCFVHNRNKSQEDYKPSELLKRKWL